MAVSTVRSIRTCDGWKTRSTDEPDRRRESRTVRNCHESLIPQCAREIAGKVVGGNKVEGLRGGAQASERTNTTGLEPQREDPIVN
jgi:hypothetical protein